MLPRRRLQDFDRAFRHSSQSESEADVGGGRASGEIIELTDGGVRPPEGDLHQRIAETGANVRRIELENIGEGGASGFEASELQIDVSKKEPIAGVAGRKLHGPLDGGQSFGHLALLDETDRLALQLP